MATKLNRCLADSESCRQTAIRAHSIQNSAGMMGLIAEDGHVVEIGLSGQPPRLTLSRVGRNRATTFTGLCAKHDAEIFRPLDTQVFDPENAEHRFLLAYRALMREHHVLRRNDVMMRKADSLPQLTGRASVDFFTEVLDRFNEYRSRYFDVALRNREFDALESRIVEIETSTATIAVSSLYSLDLSTREDGDTARAALSVVPVSQAKSMVVISWVSDDSPFVDSELNRLFASVRPEAHQLSRLILESSENFVLRPGFTDQWSDRKKEKILRAAGLLSIFRSVPDDADLMLFDV